MRFEKASERVLPGLERMLLDLVEGETGFSGTSFGRGEKPLDAFLQSCVDGEDAGKVVAGFVPQTIFWIIDEAGEVAGMVRIRHELNERLRASGGHVGYYVRPAARGKGYATAGLRFAVEFLKTKGVERVLVTVDPGNAASIKVVLANGGIPEGPGEDVVSGPAVNRYWVSSSANGQS